MEDRDWRVAVAHLLGTAMTVAPTGEVQAAFSEMVSRMGLDGCSQRAIFVELLGAIQDGVTVGNWPKRETSVAKAGG